MSNQVKVNKEVTDQKKESKKPDQIKGEKKEDREKRLKKERLARYYNNNKEKVLEYIKKPTTCEFCGHTVIRGGLKRHQRTKTCKNTYDFIKSYIIQPVKHNN